jgi:segregation and condensation protein A
MDYQVDVESFRGPLDLLLYLVKRHEIDILDIPIAKVADQFLEYLGVLQIVDVERAGDFLVMAASLMEIKSRLLLPRAETTSEEEQDPRQELVRQLLEYKKFKDAAHNLELFADKQASRLPRRVIEVLASANGSEAPLHQVELWDLVSSFGRLMRETMALEPQRIIVDQTPLYVYMDNIVSLLSRTATVPFSSIFTPPHYKSRLVGLFLALLELVRECRIQVEQPDIFGDISLRLSTSEEMLAAGRDVKEENANQ